MWHMVIYRLRAGGGDAALDLLLNHGAQFGIGYLFLNPLIKLGKNLVVELASDQIRQIILLGALKIPLE